MKAVAEIVHLPATVSKDGRVKQVAKIANFMDAAIYTRESIHGRHALTGRSVIYLYLFVKVLYLFNAVAQFFVLQHFLGAKTSWWGVQVLDDLVHGR